jgi:hypothetical protein
MFIEPSETQIKCILIIFLRTTNCIFFFFFFFGKRIILKYSVKIVYYFDVRVSGV